MCTDIKTSVSTLWIATKPSVSTWRTDINANIKLRSAHRMYQHQDVGQYFMHQHKNSKKAGVSTLGTNIKTSARCELVGLFHRQKNGFFFGIAKCVNSRSSLALDVSLPTFKPRSEFMNQHQDLCQHFMHGYQYFGQHVIHMPTSKRRSPLYVPRSKGRSQLYV